MIYNDLQADINKVINEVSYLRALKKPRFISACQKLIDKELRKINKIPDIIR